MKTIVSATIHAAFGTGHALEQIVIFIADHSPSKHSMFLNRAEKLS